MFLIQNSGLFAQNSALKILVSSSELPVKNASIIIDGNTTLYYSDTNGIIFISNLKPGKLQITCQAESHKPFKGSYTLKENDTLQTSIELVAIQETFKEFVVSGTLKSVIRSESPVPVEVYQQSYFKKNPTPNLFDALQNVNGVRPQLNCNICNTGDIHINGLEGPYTMVLIDGMPLVSSLSTVYGLSGIPNSLVERIEIVKGPASSLYGSEAVGGLINVITKRPSSAPVFSLDAFATSWGEYNADLAYKFKASKNIDVLNGINLYNFDRRVDKNDDGFRNCMRMQRSR